MSEPEIHRAALLSPDRLYRYSLHRWWDEQAPHVTFVMLNPSKADGETDDPTIRRCIAFAQSLGFGGLRVVNLFAYITPRPADLWRARAAGVDIVGSETDAWLAELGDRVATAGEPLIAAWGAGAPAERVLEVLELTGWDAFRALGVTKDGHPKHPLARGRHRIPDDAQLVPWPGAVIS